MTFDLVSSGDVTDASLKTAIEAELDAFDAWFTSPLSVGGGANPPLVPLEKALLRTYLIARLSGRFVPPRP